MAEKITSREVWIDTLRAFACICVLMVHSPIAFDGVTGGSYLLAPLNHFLMSGGVCVFFMISGALLLAKEQPLLTFYKKRFRRVAFPVLVWSLIYVLIEACKSGTGAIETIKDKNPDFILWQEVDTDGTRSYHINQKDLICEKFTGYDSVFAQNYDSPYFLYPFNEPIGANKSGILTLSRFNIESGIRKSLPVENSLTKYLDLDRAYSVSVIKTSDGKELVLYNVHLSAYTSDGTIAEEQLKILSADMQQQYDKGNYIIAAGDFNKDMLGDSSKYFERCEGEYNWAVPFNESLLPQGITSYSGSNVPSCRNAESAFKGDGTDFVLSVDGMLVSDNVEVLRCETIDTSFAYSDHNPVYLKFILKSGK